MVEKEAGGCTPPFSLALIMNIMFHFSIWFKNPKRFIFVSSRCLICSFPDIFLQLRNENLFKRRPYWEGQARMIPSMIYMISFRAFLKQKTVKRTLLQTDNILSPQMKSTLPYADAKISGISEKEKIKFDIFDILNCLSKRNMFFQFKTTFF